MLTASLEKRKELGLLRTLNCAQRLVDLTSNDYFGFAKTQIWQKEASGSTSSRLLTGHCQLYEQLEADIASFHRAQSALIFNSGYVANLGLISALGTEETTILYDLNIHASMIDGMRLSRAKCVPFRHNDLHSLEERLKKSSSQVFVLVESCYSIDGDCAPLKEIAELCEWHNAKLIVDEAHATGLFGPQGEGLVCQLNIESKVFARVHTFSKALGAHGACVLGSNELKDYLINFSRPLIYTHALAPSSLRHIARNYERLKKEALWHQQTLADLSHYFANQRGLSYSFNPIKTAVIGDITKTRELSQKLKQQGIDVRAILPPTVKQGKAALRIVLHSFNKKSEIDQLIELIS